VGKSKGMAGDGSVVPADPGAMTVVKKKTQSSRSWILIDATGHGSLLDVDKYAIMNRVQIHARDLRILDPLLSYPSTILGREKAIVLNLEVHHIFGFVFLFFLYYNFLSVYSFFYFFFCSDLAFQHIKAIITAEEVSELLILMCLLSSLEGLD